MSSTMGDIAVGLMQHLVDHSAHGYTQGVGRTGNGTVETVDVLGYKLYIEGGDRDCSSGVISVWRSIGNYFGKDFVGSATYTGDIIPQFTKTGNWVQKPTSFTPSPGDLYIKPGSHVAMYKGNGKILEFYINEKGTITGGKEGDQTGNESREVSYYGFATAILHYVGMNPPVKQGWLRDSTGWWYQLSDGSYYKSSWQKIGGKYYYFSAEGYALTGWQKYKNKWYYLYTSADSSNYECAMATGWIKLKGKWYYLGDDGAMRENEWLKYNGKWCYLKADGEAACDEVLELGGKTYAFDKNCYMFSKIDNNGALSI